MPTPGLIDHTPNPESYLAAIAREAGSSIKSVRACLDQPVHCRKEDPVIEDVTIKADLRKIRQACRNLCYVPENPLWRAKIYPEKADITFLISGITSDGMNNPYFGNMIRALIEAAREEEIRVNYSNFDQELDYSNKENLLPPCITDGLSNKFIIAGRSNESLVDELMNMQANLVFLSRSSDIPGTVSVVPDYRGAAKQAVNMLCAHGHRSIAIAGAEYFSEKGYNYRQLVAGAMDAASDLGIQMSEDDIFIANDSHPYDRPAFITSIRSSPRNYTGVFCLDDTIAMALYMSAKLINLTIPDDLSLVGCNDHQDLDTLHPRLSTVHVPARRMGQQAFEEAVNLVRHERPNTAKLVILPTTPTLRGSIKFV